MRQISLLDCTLRDGGYVNDWKFGRINIASIFERLVDANIDIVEVGFLDDRRPYDIDRSILPNTNSLDSTYGKLDKKNTKIAAMIDFGTCDIKNIAPKKDTCIDIIRVIFKKGKMYDAMKFCKQVKDLGYDVCSQLVSITSYNDDELLEVIKLINDVKPFAVGIVDTYGLLNKNKLLHIYEILDNNVSNEVKIGFHAHNNFQLAYSNSQSFLEYAGNHDLIVDGSLFGMGKSAGNTPIELLSMTLNNDYNKNYNINSMLEAIKESIMDFYKVSPWGYNLFFYLVAKNDCHPNYLTDYKKEENLSISMLDDVLAEIEPNEKKLLYEKEISKNTYKNYIKNNTNDAETIESIGNLISNKKVLLLGPGKNVELQKDLINDFISKNNPYIISINYVPKDIETNCVFITNIIRYHDMTLDLNSLSDDSILIATTNVSSRFRRIDYTLNRAPLLEKNEKIQDNSFLMFLKILSQTSAKKVYCAGFDGYSSKDVNYFNPSMEYSFIKQEADNLNSHVKDVISELRKTMEIEFITYSAYDVEEDINGAAF